MTLLKQNIIAMHGDDAKQWLDSLTETTAKIATQHNLSGLTPISNFSIFLNP